MTFFKDERMEQREFSNRLMALLHGWIPSGRVELMGYRGNIDERKLYVDKISSKKMKGEAQRAITISLNCCYAGMLDIASGKEHG